MNESNPQAELYAMAAAAMKESGPLYWPGNDYPDREVWLKKRAAQRETLPVVRIYASRKPLALGINVAKRRADAEDAKTGGTGNPKASRGKRIVKYRHEYYRNRGTPS